MRMIKANQTEPTPAGSMAINLDGIRYLRDNLQFPIDQKAREARKQYQAIESNISYLEERVQMYERDMAQAVHGLGEEKEKLAKMDVPPDEEAPNLERAKAQLDALAGLPWIEKVEHDGPQLRVTTRIGMLKTKLDKRIVNFGGGNYRVEYLAEPVYVEMPQYEINFMPASAPRGPWANRTSNLGIRLINAHDTEKYIGGKVFAQQTAYPHWAANGNYGVGGWCGLCLGEYAKDLEEASAKGLVPFFEALATYLQTSEDEHAYRPKPDWALLMGKPEYNEFVLRTPEKDETPDMVAERYRRDFRLMNHIEFDEEATVNPGEQTNTERRDSRRQTLQETARLMAMMQAPIMQPGRPFTATEIGLGRGGATITTSGSLGTEAHAFEELTRMVDNRATEMVIDEVRRGPFNVLRNPIFVDDLDDEAVGCPGEECEIEDCACECHDDEGLMSLVHD